MEAKVTANFCPPGQEYAATNGSTTGSSLSAAG
eukprot:CAMPEP_0172731738 /NCGR_PEP_ID=MMETSP1074-20121228/102310_1 /TAXON_ID=2916 /ORGANISM="Ceratium fusus, Strain PA161109" /LENGTH=32 /DNA_ID= /DNA_START= /DNA_END= /DNA_ORIENTATION=